MRTLITTFATLLFVLMMVACQSKTYSETVQIDLTIKKVVVDVAIGDVEIQGNAGWGSVVNTDLECRVAVPDVLVHVESDVLWITMKGGTGGASDCKGGFEIEIPRAAAVSVRTGQGEVNVSDIAGGVQLSSYDGDIEVNNLAGAVDIQAALGDVTGQGLTGSEGRVYVGYGDVAFAYGKTPSFVDVDIILGNARLTVPENAYSINADTLEGVVDIKGLTSVPDAGRLLWLMVDTGDIRIAGAPLLSIDQE